MSPVTHGLLSWLLAQNRAVKDRRSRIAITVAGLAPDLDGFGYPFEALTRHAEHPLDWFSRYHHELCHNFLACAVFAAIAWGWTRSWAVGLLAGAASLLHLFCDLIGARGPDGFQWPLPLLAPFSHQGFTWSGQWRLDSWQNLVITLAAVAVAVVIGLRHGRTPVELISRRADARVVDVLRARLGRRTSPPTAEVPPHEVPPQA